MAGFFYFTATVYHLSRNFADERAISLIMNSKPSRQPSASLFKPEHSTHDKIPLAVAGISAGFPSPAEDFIDKKLDLNEYLIKNQPATFLVRVHGSSMVDAGIYDSDLLVVDRSLEPRDGKIVVGVIDGEFTVKRIIKKEKRFFLQPEN
jgi:DNA polymerase V